LEELMMSKDELRQAIILDLKRNGPYCCYCCDPKGEKYSCCSENHFVPFGDLYEDQQEEIIEAELDEWERNI